MIDLQAVVALLIAVIFTVPGLAMFYTGLHNVDLGHNFGAAGWPADIGLDGTVRSPGELYILGMGQIYTSAYLIFGGAMLLGFVGAVLWLKD